MDKTLENETAATWFIMKRKKKDSEYKSQGSKGSDVVSTHTQIPVSLRMCVKLFIWKNGLGVCNCEKALV